MLHIEAASLQPAAHLGGLKPEPQVRQLTQALVFVARQIDDGQLAPVPEGPAGFLQGDGGCRHMVQDHAGHDRIGLAVADGQVFEIAEAEVAAFDVGASRNARQVEHSRRGVDGDHPVGSLEQRREQQPRAGA